MLCIYYNLYVNVTVSFIFFPNKISGLPQLSLCLSKVHFLLDKILQHLRLNV